MVSGNRVTVRMHSIALACWRDLEQSDLVMPDDIERDRVLAWPAQADRVRNASECLRVPAQSQATHSSHAPFTQENAATQHALAGDAASRPQDRGFFEICIQLETLSDLVCGATEAQSVGSPTCLTHSTALLSYYLSYRIYTDN